MSGNSNFTFIGNEILRNNLDMAFSHILKLITVLGICKEKEEQSAFGKTVIIYTASIIEALLLWLIKQKIKESKTILDFNDCWKYENIKILHKFGSKRKKEIICGNRLRKVKNLNKLDFNLIIRIVKYNKIITDKTFINNLDKVRQMRNKIHIGGLKEVEKEYTKNDLEFIFSVAKEIKEICIKY